MKKELRELDEIIKIQCSNGNRNYSPYMYGMANGLLLAKSIITNTEVEYMNQPERWLRDRTIRQRLSLFWLKITNNMTTNEKASGVNTKLEATSKPILK